MSAVHFEDLHPEEQAWIEAYLDRTIADSALDELQAGMRHSPKLRRVMRRSLALANELRQEASAAESSAEAWGNTTPLKPTTTAIQNPAPLRWSIYLAAAVVTLATIISAMFLNSRAEASIATITGIDGVVTYTGNGGRVADQIEEGQKLPIGTLELLSADSWVELAFRDGSKVSLSSLSAATLFEGNQKEVHLHHGTLAAHITPQPTVRPMLIHTPTADMEVISTRFNVDARPAKTKLTVTEGRVRLKRLSDGQEVSVPERHKAVASIEDDQGLVLTPRGAHTTQWKSDLKADAIHGKWSPDFGALSQELEQAVASGTMEHKEAFVAIKKAAQDGRGPGTVRAQPTSLGSLVLLKVATKTAAPVAIALNSRLRIQGRLHHPADLVFGITTTNDLGDYAGKYSLPVAQSRLSETAPAFDLELPLSEFQQKDPRFSAFPLGAQLDSWWCVTDGKSTKLEITGVELLD